MTMPHNPDPAWLIAQAGKALDTGNEAAIEPLLAAHLAQHPNDSALLHWQALLLRALDRRGEALPAMVRARQLAPADSDLLHAQAQIALEAGQSATSLFEAAVRDAPGNGERWLGLTAARYAEGAGAQALDDLAKLLQTSPGWIEGHRQYAQLAALLGRADHAMHTLDRAIAAHPDADQLYLLAQELLLDAERFGEALTAVDRAIARFGEGPALLLNRAAARDELGDHTGAAADLDRLGPAEFAAHAVRRLRHMLRAGDLERACAEIEPWLDRTDATPIWPYAALAWRATSDDRAEWLEGQEGLIRIADLADDGLDLAAIAETLRAIHVRSGRFLDQSVRHGTQTNGPLLARIDPAIVVLRSALVQAVADYVQQLPGPDPRHPTLSQQRDRPIRFAGSWSVRLTGAGFHASHHHPQGWISSACYITVPGVLALDEGQLVLGESPPDLGLGLPPQIAITPRPGQLVLFPSTMWHATRPFAAGERLTVAFDVAQP